jgi:predicted nucleic acid-binding protein
VTLIFNASPLIILAKAGLMDVVCGLAETLWVPSQVAAEIHQKPDPNDPARVWLANGKPKVHLVPDYPIDPFVAGWDLGRGESAVLSLPAPEQNTFRVLDDLAARRCALALGLSVMGTLGLVLLAKKRGFLPSIEPALQSVVASGLFISPHHLSAIQRAAAEQ